MKELFAIIRERLHKKEPLVLVTVTESSGSTPRGAGALMLVGRDMLSCAQTGEGGGAGSGVAGTARLWGSIGGGLPEHEAIKKAASILQGIDSEAPVPRACLQNYALRPDDAADMGARCGGELTVFFRVLDSAEPRLPELAEKVIDSFSGNKAAWFLLEINKEQRANYNEQLAKSKEQITKSNDQIAVGIAQEDGSMFFTGGGPRDINALLKTVPTCLEDGGKRWFSVPLVSGGIVYIFGGGHIAQELVPLLARLDFRCVVFDDRGEFTKPELFPCAEKIILGDFKNIGESVSLTENDYAVIVTRGHICDIEAWAFALDSPAAYIGVIGSKTKHAFVREQLVERGFNRDTVNAARVRAPIGMDIKSKTPAEIAVSIAGELVLTRARIREEPLIR